MTLCPDGWVELLSLYHDPEISKTLQGIARYGAKVGYEGPAQAIRQPYLVSAKEAPNFIDGDLELNLRKGRVAETRCPGSQFIISLLGLVPKPLGCFRRIHHVSAPLHYSVNDHIPSHYGQLNYALFNEALDHIWRAGPGAILIKQDLADAFRQIHIHPTDWWLFGFDWRGRLFQERYLPFGLWTAPRTFNLFAEGLHWVIASRSMAAIIPYLDYFLAIFAAADAAAAHEYEQFFETTCQVHGLRIKVAKNALGTTVEFLGLIMDNMTMEACLPADKTAWGLQLITELAMRKSCSSLDLQRVTRLLNFLAKVISFGCTFSPRLYDLEQRFPLGGGRSVLR